MSKPMKKTGKRILITLVILALLASCFGAVALYAKNEINKPRFQMPEIDPLPSASSLPTEKGALTTYLNQLYASAVSSDEAEGAWRTDVDLSGEMVLPFAEDDNAIISLIRDGAAGEFAALYPSASGVKLSETKDAPQIVIDENAVTEFTAEQGRENDSGERYDEDYYFVDLTLDPASIDTQSILSGTVFADAIEKLSAAVLPSSPSVEAKNFEMHFKIDRITDQLLSAQVRTELLVTADIALTDDYAPLLNDQATAQVSLPYKTTQYIDFNWYGARFTERAIVAKAGDMTALPADVSVNGDATAEDYTLTFTASDPDAITIDADGVMTVHKAPEETATITMTLKYGQHTYTDTLTVYITELEVETDV